MDRAESWAPLDRALAAYRAGDLDASLTVHTDAGGADPFPMAVFFRSPTEMAEVEVRAFGEARGRVLDVGAGAGAFSAPLTARGHEVTSLEHLPGAAAILLERGVRDVRHGGLELVAPEERFDTVLVLMNGLGLAGSLAGLGPFLARLAAHLAPDGRILTDSTDPRAWEAADDGRYPGEVHMQLEWRGVRGDPFPFLYVDGTTLAKEAAAVGLRCRLLMTDEGGRFLARLSR